MNLMLAMGPSTLASTKEEATSGCTARPRFQEVTEGVLPTASANAEEIVGVSDGSAWMCRRYIGHRCLIGPQEAYGHRLCSDENVVCATWRGTRGPAHIQEASVVMLPTSMCQMA